MVPQQRLSLAALWLVVPSAVGVYFALQVPSLGLRFVPDGDRGIAISAIAADSPNTTRVQIGDTFHLALLADGSQVPLVALTLIEEPDQIELWDDYFLFLDQQGQLAHALRQGSLVLLRDDGGAVELVTRPRRITELPVLFWVQGVLVGGGCLLIAAGVWAFRSTDLPARLFLTAGASIHLSALAAAVYGSRELAMAADTFRALSLLNHLGAMAFTAGLFGLLWTYPRRLGPGWLIWVGFATVVVALSINVFQLSPYTAAAFYWPVLVLFGCTFLFAWLQWRTTRHLPVQRAALKWFLLSIYVGTGLFAAFILVPVALAVPPPASQGVMFAVFLIMFVGIALGIVHYRLFDLDRWWFEAWGWFLSGALVLLLDGALVWLFDINEQGALLVALAVVGWGYFPVRQWLWTRMRPTRVTPIHVGQWIQTLLAADHTDSLQHHWREVLAREFAVLDVVPSSCACTTTALGDDGQTMLVADLVPGQCLRLAYPDKGSRLFGKEDRARAELMLGVARQAHDALFERQRLVNDERDRIMRDLHDDLGAKLLSLIHLARDGEGEQVARSAVQDMREILTALEAQACSLEEANAEWRSEAQRRAETHSFQLEWRDDGLTGPMRLTARQRTSVARILREAITNAARHTVLERLLIETRCEGGRLILDLESHCTGASIPPEQWRAGRGLRGMERRAADIGATLRWAAQPDGARLTMTVPCAGLAVV